jgi:hypothetical protein
MIQEVDTKGNIGAFLWQKILPSSLTSLDATSDWIALGLSLGEVWIVDRAGQVIFSLEREEGEDTLILGVALGQYGGETYLAFVQGRREAQWFLYKREGDSWRQQEKGDLGSSLKRETRLIFDVNHPILFVEREEGFLVYDIKKKRQDFVKSKGILINAFQGFLGSIYSLSFDLSQSQATLFESSHGKVVNAWSWKDSLGSRWDWIFLDNQTLWLTEADSTLWILDQRSP